MSEKDCSKISSIKLELKLNYVSTVQEINILETSKDSSTKSHGYTRLFWE